MEARRRAVLIVPASSGRMVAKSAGISVDEIVFDLEDAVVDSEKDRARAQLLEDLSRRRWSAARLGVRVNAVGSAWCHTDLAAIARSEAISSIVLPKVDTAEDVAYADRLLAGLEASLERRRPLAIQVLIETAAGLLNAKDLPGASARVESLVIGYEDLGGSLGRTVSGAWEYAQQAVLVAARAEGVQAVDGPYLSVNESLQLRAEVSRAAELGYDGKWAIHPDQIGMITRAFTPSAEEIASAEALLKALEEGERSAKGAVLANGRMIDEASAVAARRVLARACAGGGDDR